VETDAMAMSASHLPLIGIQLRTRGVMRLDIVLVKMGVMIVKSLGSGRAGLRRVRTAFVSWLLGFYYRFL
jgi:hypothetical protein